MDYFRYAARADYLEKLIDEFQSELKKGCPGIYRVAANGGWVAEQTSVFENKYIRSAVKHREGLGFLCRRQLRYG